MPEGSEVKLLSETLEKLSKGKGIVSIEIRNPDAIVNWINRNVIGLDLFKIWLAEHNGFLEIESINTKGKLCWVQCVDNIHIRIQFGMSGNFREDPTPETLSVYNQNRKLNGKKPESLEQYLKHCHVKIGFAPSTNHNDITYVMYHDVRRFGRLIFSNNPNELKAKINSLGTDPLIEKLSKEEILSRFRKYNHQNICKALMDNGIICNVGNYICNETNYRAKIYPLANIKDIPDSALLDLYNHIIKIGKDAYEQQGASLYTYSGIKGEQSNFKEQLLVYGHAGEKDPNGYSIIRIPAEKSPNKRSIYWVPEIQTIGKKDDNKIDTVYKKKIIVVLNKKNHDDTSIINAQPKKKILILKNIKK